MKVSAARAKAFSKLTLDELQLMGDADLSQENRGRWQVEMMTRPCPLRPDLQPFLKMSPVIGALLRHPLFVGHCDPNKAAIVHWIIDYNRKDIERLAAEGDWYNALFVHEIPYLLDAFIKYVPQFDDKTY